MNQLIQQWTQATGHPSPQLIRISPAASLALAARGDLANITVPVEIAPILPSDCCPQGTSMGIVLQPDAAPGDVVVMEHGTLRACILK